MPLPPPLTLLCPAGDFGPVTADANAPAWQKIVPVSLRETVTGGAPNQATELRVAVSGAHLRVLFDCADQDVWATKTMRDDRLYEEEVVEVFLDPVGDLECYFEIELNPLNTVLDLVLRKSPSGLKKETITARNVPFPDLHHPHAIRSGELLFVSGLCATDFKVGLAPEAQVHSGAPWFASSGRKQTAFILDCMEAICRAGGSSVKNVVWTQNFYSRPEDVCGSMEVWNERFPTEPPATLVAGVGRPVFGEGCTIHIDAVAAVD